MYQVAVGQYKATVILFLPLLMVFTVGCTFAYLLDSGHPLNHFQEFAAKCQVLCFLFNPFNPRVKPWVMQSFLIFDSMDRTVKCENLLETH